MFRFFCTTCKTIRRTRKIPSIIHPHYELIKDIKQRKGACDYHGNSKDVSHRQFNKIERGR